MTYVFITLGAVIRLMSIMMSNYKKYDWIYFSCAVIIACLAGLQSFAKDPSLDPGILALIPLVTSGAYFFKEKILPTITEGILFAYGLSGSYLFYTHSLSSSQGATNLDIVIMLFICCYISLSFVIILSKNQISKSTQTFFMVLYLLMAIYITYALSQTIDTNESILNAILIGFFYFPVLANISYIMEFIPLPSRHRSFKQKLADIEEHSNVLAKKFHPVDSTLVQIISTLVLFTGTILCIEYKVISEAMGVSFFLGFSILIHNIPKHSVFTPRSVQ